MVYTIDKYFTLFRTHMPNKDIIHSQLEEQKKTEKLDKKANIVNENFNKALDAQFSEDQDIIALVKASKNAEALTLLKQRIDERDLSEKQDDYLSD